MVGPIQSAANQTGQSPSVLLIISGSIAAYKALDLIRLLRKEQVTIRTIITESGQQFITPMAVAALSEGEVYTDLFSLKDETEMGHIRLSRESDLICVVPASADLLAKMAQGRADCLASATLLASDAPIMAAPAMNVRMWENKATQRNIAQLKVDGVELVGPDAGSMACGETGDGRMSEPETIRDAILARLSGTALQSQSNTANDRKTATLQDKPLSGQHALVTAGPTFEPIDAVRFIGNRSSGKQGYAIAAELAALGARVTLVSGPVALDVPAGVNVIRVETAEAMFNACRNALPADILVSAAAVSDWRVTQAQPDKIKKTPGKTPPALSLEETVDILHQICHDTEHCPALTIGFAAETVHSEEALVAIATEKKQRKGCDWIVANDVSNGHAFGADENSVVLITDSQTFRYPTESKQGIARAIAKHICDYLPDIPTTTEPQEKLI